ncbi:DNA-directed RNA polymerase subunit omega [bacterium]|nr:MAG: DNA-directed RNA polymerase subunit omega [bacterium]RKZ21600.1 MAG: DNA-directed RNA polymerase subunit omega [bacterium]
MFIPVEKIWEVIENKYEAIMVAAKEARRLNQVDREKYKNSPAKPTLDALRKLVEKKIKYIYKEE